MQSTQHVAQMVYILAHILYDCDDVTCLRTRTPSRQHVRERVCLSSFRSCASDSRNQLHSKLKPISTFSITLDCALTYVCVCVCVSFCRLHPFHTHTSTHLLLTRIWMYAKSLTFLCLMEAERVIVSNRDTMQNWSRALKVRKEEHNR